MKTGGFGPTFLRRARARLGVLAGAKRDSGVYSSYTEAQDACATAGYEDDGLVAAVCEKTRLAKEAMLDRKFAFSSSASQSLMAVLLAWREHQARFQVIDFGGACGAHYFQIRPFLSPDVRVSWVVVETPAMVAKAKPLETHELQFCTSLSQARENLQAVDLFHSSGTLQYVPDPELVINQTLEVCAAWLFFNRLACIPGPNHLVSIQESLLSANGPGALPAGFSDGFCRYPITYIGLEWLESRLAGKYRTDFRFEGSLIGEIQRNPIHSTGFVARRVD